MKFASRSTGSTHRVSVTPQATSAKTRLATTSRRSRKYAATSIGQR